VKPININIPNHINIPNRKILQEEYESCLSRREGVLDELQQRMKMLLSCSCVHSTIKTRVKSFESYYHKILRRMRGGAEEQNQDLRITDILGMRIICPFLDDLTLVENLIRRNFQVVEVERKGAHHSFKEFGYESIHFLIEIPDDILSRFEIRENLVCEVQIRTILQEAWAEVEHELIYKGEFTPFDEPLKRKLAAINANLTLSDIIFQEIRDYQRQLRDQLKKRRESFFKKTQIDTLQIGSEHKRKIVSELETQTKGEIGNSYIGHQQDNIDNLLLKALNAHNSNQLDLAIDIYTSILNLKPQAYIQAIIYIHRGMAYFAASNYEQAVNDFSAATQLDQKNDKAFYYRALVHSTMQNYHKALEDFNQCLSLNPYQYDPLYSRAQVYFHLGDYPKALADCEQALNIHPESEQAKKFREMVMAYLHI